MDAGTVGGFGTYGLPGESSPFGSDAHRRRAVTIVVASATATSRSTLTWLMP